VAFDTENVLGGMFVADINDGRGAVARSSA